MSVAGGLQGEKDAPDKDNGLVNGAAHISAGRIRKEIRLRPFTVRGSHQMLSFLYASLRLCARCG